MAAVTKNLAFGITSSTSFEPPFLLAKRFSTLDHLTGGRVGWNIVTSWKKAAFKAIGLDSPIEHDERYAQADEYLRVLYKYASAPNQSNNDANQPPIDYGKAPGPPTPSPPTPKQTPTSTPTKSAQSSTRANTSTSTPATSSTPHLNAHPSSSKQEPPPQDQTSPQHTQKQSLSQATRQRSSARKSPTSAT